MVESRKSVAARIRSAMILVFILAIPLVSTVPAAAVELEPGVTFYDDGTCQEADGTWGLPEASGQCITPADYNEMFSYEALSQVPLHGDDGVSVADAYGITADSPKASVRVRVFQGVSLGTFGEYVSNAHQVAL